MRTRSIVMGAFALASVGLAAQTTYGKLLPNTKTALFKKTVKAPVHIPLSGKTMEFDGSGKCVSGC